MKSPLAACESGVSPPRCKAYTKSRTCELCLLADYRRLRPTVRIMTPLSPDRAIDLGFRAFGVQQRRGQMVVNSLVVADPRRLLLEQQLCVVDGNKSVGAVEKITLPFIV